METPGRIANLVRDYSPFSPDEQLMELLACYRSGGDLCAHNARKVINELALSHYQNEAIIKHALVSKFVDHAKSDEVVFFEFPVEGNRADLCRVNSHSFAYEIKTEFDSFERLPQQLKSYCGVFDYVYVVLPLSVYRNARPQVPEGVGFVTYRRENEQFKFCYRERAERNEATIEKRLACLSLRDIRQVLKDISVDTPAASSRMDYADQIGSWAACHPARFERLYLDVFKRKYRDRWSFLRDNFEEILPLDMQASFAKRICLSKS